MSAVEASGLVMRFGDTLALDAQRLLRPLEHALRAMSWSVVLLAAALALVRLG